MKLGLPQFIDISIDLLSVIIVFQLVIVRCAHDSQPADEAFVEPSPQSLLVPMIANQQMKLLLNPHHNHF